MRQFFLISVVSIMISLGWTDNTLAEEKIDFQEISDSFQSSIKNLQSVLDSFDPDAASEADLEEITAAVERAFKSWQLFEEATIKMESLPDGKGKGTRLAFGYILGGGGLLAAAYSGLWLLDFYRPRHLAGFGLGIGAMALGGYLLYAGYNIEDLQEEAKAQLVAEYRDGLVMLNELCELNRSLEANEIFLSDLKLRNFANDSCGTLQSNMKHFEVDLESDS